MNGMRWLRVVLLAVLAAGCASSTRESAPPATPVTELSRLAARHRVCGVALAVIKDRRLDAIETASGCEPPLAVAPDSVFQAASLSKPVFAYAVLKLVQQGRLELDAPVVRYLPQGYRHAFDPLNPAASASSDEVTDPRIREVTVRMALNHTAGLPNWASGPLRFVAGPGERWAYSGEGYVLLQQAIEAVTGMPLDRFMREQVFAPLHMRHSSYAWNEEIAARLLPGTKANGAPRKTLALRRPVAAFTLYTTVEDYGRFLAAVLQDERALALIAARAVTADPVLDLHWGLGWGIERTPDGVHLWHWGNNPGYRAFVVASVRSGAGLVMLSNNEAGLRLAEPLTRAVLPGEHRLFRSPLLGGGITEVLCERLRWCL